MSSRSAPPPAEDSLMAGRDTSVMELTWGARAQAHGDSFQPTP